MRTFVNRKNGNNLNFQTWNHVSGSTLRDGGGEIEGNTAEALGADDLWRRGCGDSLGETQTGGHSVRCLWESLPGRRDLLQLQGLRPGRHLRALRGLFHQQ